MRKTCFRQNGDSLIEVIVAIFILSIGIVGVLPMLSINLKSNVAARTNGIANFLGQQKLEQVKAWPLYEDQGSNLGITAANTALFGSETGLRVNNWAVDYTRTTEMFRNGYGIYDCSGIVFGTSGGSYVIDETTGGSTANMNTGSVNPCAGGGGFRGEDFKVIRVTVAWDDAFGAHSIKRFMYISRF